MCVWGGLRRVLVMLKEPGVSMGFGMLIPTADSPVFLLPMKREKPVW